jgi:hypothetical protein
MSLLAELMDNATQFSPPRAEVQVEVGHLDGRLVVAIHDQGVGIPVERLEQLNQSLAEPPSIDVSAIRSMGLTVVANIASRYDVRVLLRPAALMGVVAEVHLPRELWRVDDVIASIHDGQAIARIPAPRPPARAPVPAIARPVAADPEPPIFRDVASHFRGYFVSAAEARDAWQGVADAGWAAARAAATPTVTGQTRVGLPRRDPQANLVPGAVPDGSRAGAVDIRDPARVAAAVAAFAHGNAYHRARHARPSPS